MEDSKLAVLNALHTTGAQGKPCTAPNIFGFLPRILRQKWNERYLAEVMLRNLEQSECVSISCAQPGILQYRLTLKGRCAIQ